MSVSNDIIEYRVSPCLVQFCYVRILGLSSVILSLDCTSVGKKMLSCPSLAILNTDIQSLFTEVDISADLKWRSLQIYPL